MNTKKTKTKESNGTVKLPMKAVKIPK